MTSAYLLMGDVKCVYLSRAKPKIQIIKQIRAIALNHYQAQHSIRKLNFLH